LGKLSYSFLASLDKFEQLTGALVWARPVLHQKHLYSRSAVPASTKLPICAVWRGWRVCAGCAGCALVETAFHQRRGPGAIGPARGKWTGRPAPAGPRQTSDNSVDSGQAW